MGKYRIASFDNWWAFAWSLKASCDAQTNSIKICTKMVEYAKFLNSVGQLFDTFSIHCKGTGYSVKSADEALSLVRQCKELLERNTNEIRMSTGITSAINGPQGHVSARTVASVALLEWGLQRLYSNLQLKFNLSLELYDTVRRELPFHCSYQTSEHVHDVVC